MKLPPLLAFATLATVAILPRPAAAGSDEALAAVGGFIGGVIVGAHIERHDRPNWHDRYDRRDRHDRGGWHDRRDRRDWHDRRDHHDRRGPIIIDRGPHHRSGYWTERTVRVWVPERSVWSVDRWGRRVRHCEPGHYEYRRERVWVEDRGHHRRW